MEILRFFTELWAKSKTTFWVAVVTGTAVYFIPKFFEKSEQSNQLNITLLKDQVVYWQGQAAFERHRGDSLSFVLDKERTDNINALSNNVKDLREYNKKYRDALLKTKQVSQTIDNTIKNVNDEIK